MEPLSDLDLTESKHTVTEETGLLTRAEGTSLSEVGEGVYLLKYAYRSPSFAKTHDFSTWRSDLIPIDLCPSLTVMHFHSLDLLIKTYELNNPPDIFSFLDLYKEIMPLLLECDEAIKEYFGNITPILEAITDAEDLSWKTLYITLPDFPDFDKALDNLDRLLKEWFYYQPTNFKKLVTINVL